MTPTLKSATVPTPASRNVGRYSYPGTESLPRPSPSLPVLPPRSFARGLYKRTCKIEYPNFSRIYYDMQSSSCGLEGGYFKLREEDDVVPATPLDRTKKSSCVGKPETTTVVTAGVLPARITRSSGSGNDREGSKLTPAAVQALDAGQQTGRKSQRRRSPQRR